MTTGLHVAERIAGLCLDDSGHLSDNAYLQMAVRGGLLVDLALAQRLFESEDSVGLETTPIGWPPADRALIELGYDDLPLDGWLESSHLGLPDLAAALVTDGAWQSARRHAWRVTPRYAVLDRAQRTRDGAMLRGVESPETAEDAALLSITTAAGLPGRKSSASIDDLLVRTGGVRWVCQLVMEFISGARANGTAVSGASQTALWSGMPY